MSRFDEPAVADRVGVKPGLVRKVVDLRIVAHDS
jgi:hypothetical protein